MRDCLYLGIPLGGGVAWEELKRRRQHSLLVVIFAFEELQVKRAPHAGGSPIAGGGVKVKKYDWTVTAFFFVLRLSIVVLSKLRCSVENY